MSLGGFYAGGESEGLNQGIQNYNMILNNAQNRKQAAEKHELDITDRMNKISAQTRMMENQFGAQDPMVQQMQQRMDDLNKQLSKQRGGAIKALVNRIFTSSEPQRELPATKKYFKDNPEAAQTIGLKNPESLRMPDINNEADVIKIKKQLSKALPGTYTEEELNKVIKGTYASGMFLMADDHLVNVYGLGKAMGSFSYLDEEGRDKAEQKAAHILGARREEVPAEGSEQKPQTQSVVQTPPAPGETETSGGAALEGPVGTPNQINPQEEYGAGAGQGFFGEGQGPQTTPTTSQEMTSSGGMAPGQEMAPSQDWYLAQAAGWSPYSTRESKLTEPKIKQEYDFLRQTKGEEFANKWLDSKIEESVDTSKLKQEYNDLVEIMGPEKAKKAMEVKYKIAEETGNAEPMINANAYPGAEQDLQNQAQIQGMSSTRATELSGYYKTNVLPKYQTAKSWMGTRNRVFDILDKIDYNVLNKGISDLQKKIGPDWTSKLTSLLGKDKSQWTKEDYELYQRLNTVLSKEMADYIRSISGAAASNEEREFLMNTVFGGFWTDETALRARLDEFTNRTIKDAERALNDPNSRMWAPNQSRAYLNDLYGTAKTASKTSGTSTNTEVKNLVRQALSKPENIAKLKRGEAINIGGAMYKLQGNQLVKVK